MVIIVMNEERIVIRTNREVKQKWRELSVRSGVSNYNEFANKLLELYEVMSEKRGIKNITNLVYHEKLGVDIKF